MGLFWAVALLFFVSSFETSASDASPESAQGTCEEILEASKNFKSFALARREGEAASTHLTKIEKTLLPVPDEEKQLMQSTADQLVTSIVEKGWHQASGAVSSLGNLQNKGMMAFAERAQSMIHQEGLFDNDTVYYLQQLRQLAKPQNVNQGALGTSWWQVFLPTPSLRKRLLWSLKKNSVVQQQIDRVVSHLENGAQKLFDDTNVLVEMYQEIIKAQQPLSNNIYMCDVLMDKIKALRQEVQDPQKLSALDLAAQRVSVQRQDLLQIFYIHAQSLAFIENLTAKNDMLCDQITRTCNMVSQVLPIGMSLQVALAQQKQKINVLKQLQENPLLSQPE